LGYEVKEDEMGGKCCMHSRDEKFKDNFGQKTYSEDLGIDGKIILDWILGK
jgi:hypothetical protein